MFGKKGFTLIELVMVIVILGILAAVAIPKYYDLQNDAKSAAEKGVVGGVRAGIHTYYAQNKAWPANLDAAAASSTASKANAFFTVVLSQGGITSEWTKNASSQYVGPAGGIYAYSNVDGSFVEQ